MKVLFPNNVEITNINQTRSLEVYNDQVIEFLNTFSKILLKHPKVKQYPDVATFGFFCRRANLLGIKNQYYNENELRLGKGVVFHIAPSNVPVNFAYSFVCGLLSGNINVVKVPSKDFEQIDIIVESLNKLVLENDFPLIKEKLFLIKYPREDNHLTVHFSSQCDVRVIWGGDETISKIRESAIPSKAFDVTFADRYSICAIHAEQYLELENDNELIRGFYNDTYLFDQNACTAPHLIVWIGDDDVIFRAKERFWSNLDRYLLVNDNDIEPVIAVDKLTTFLEHSIVSESKPSLNKMDNNLIWRSDVHTLEKGIHAFKCNSGYFLEYSARNINEIDQFVTRKFQTLSYFGFSKSELQDFVLWSKPLGIDRIVPIGRTVDFEIIWDGYNLIDTLSRICVIN
ncbi:MAG: acyl-CoA reductase [Flavobacteriales bacterium]